MVNIIMRLLGLGKAVDALDSDTNKAYLGGLGQMLAGAAAVLGSLANIVQEVVPLHGASAYVGFAEHVSHDPNVAALVAGVGLFHLGLAAIEQRKATAVVAKAVGAAAAPESAEQPAALPPAKP